MSYIHVLTYISSHRSLLPFLV